jgi:hypothetical protein
MSSSISAMSLAHVRLLPKQSKMGKTRDRTQWWDIWIDFEMKYRLMA